MAGETMVPLCDEQTKAVNRAIYANMAPDDRHPSEIVTADYDGNWNNYLNAMAVYYEIDLSQIGKVPEGGGL